ncbi:platelet endothelial aggregation receptor 1-like isoform X1 [Ostrea edulis]|uniref:platelet endothelial aggregation receptor 1-like isoform X1 n=1 Tax=Ostrea edulis TaxID=37623 RepID=UPI0024AFAE48|nr:platelet endothelial aggregation receptor 1-like isoform X1 [Ostrea edulis]
MWKSGYMYFLYFGICVLLPSSESLNKTNGGNCGTNGEINCCHNYYQAKNTCVECPNGTYGRNCSLNCSENTYGKNCLKLCNCKPDETCDSKSGTCSVKPGYCRNGTRTVETPCCNNYLYVNTTCTKCPIGTYGFNCSQICSSGYYGKLCIKQCECQPNETCDPKHGCKGAGTDGSSGAFTRIDPWVVGIVGVSAFLIALSSIGAIGWLRYYKLRQRQSHQGVYSQPLPCNLQLVSIPEEERYEQMVKDTPHNDERDPQPSQKDDDYLELQSPYELYVNPDDGLQENSTTDMYEDPREQKDEMYLHPVSDGYTRICA